MSVGDWGSVLCMVVRMLQPPGSPRACAVVRSLLRHAAGQDVLPLSVRLGLTFYYFNLHYYPQDQNGTSIYDQLPFTGLLFMSNVG